MFPTVSFSDSLFCLASDNTTHDNDYIMTVTSRLANRTKKQNKPLQKKQTCSIIEVRKGWVRDRNPYKLCLFVSGAYIVLLFAVILPKPKGTTPLI